MIERRRAPWLAPGVAALGALLALATATPALADPPPAAKLLEGYQAQGGLYRLHQKGHQVFLEIPAGQLGRPFLLATSVTGGPEYAGFQWGDMVCAWERVDDRLLLVEREVRYRVRDRRLPIQDVVSRTYTDRVVRAMPIAALNGQNPVVDLNSLFGGQATSFFGPLAARLDASVVRVESLKVFPQNVVVRLSLPDGRRDGRLTELGYSLSFLPDPSQDPYRPRVADDRVGYFLTAIKDWTDDGERGDRFVRYVNRWNLEKADPRLERSPVKQPIVFYVEKTVPYRFRQAVADGILEWNKAFEKVGLLGAIEVRQQTDTQFADLDPEDVRHNFFRWIVSERAFAMGPSRVNPWTGQILDADIVFDESMVRVYLRDYDVAIREAPRQFFPPGVQRQLDAEPRRFPFAQVPESDDLQFLRPDARGCSLGSGVSHQLSLGLIAAQLDGEVAAGPNGGYPTDFIEEIVKDVVMHEVGHTLGLRHNFKASSWRAMAEINCKDSPADITGSVMDYNPINVRPTEEDVQGNFTMRTIGPYDFWAIQYGYGLFPNEDAGLKATVAQVASPQYTYATDEDATGPDPLALRWDLGADPLVYAEGRMQLSSRLWKKAVDRVVNEGESFRDARRAVDMLLFDYQNAAMIATRFVGGQFIHRDHRGDPGAREPVVPVPAEQQRRALKLICERVLAEGNFDLPPELLRQLGKGHWTHWGSSDWQQPHSYPFHDRVLGIQSWVLFGVMNPGTLLRLVDTEAKTGADQDVVTVPEVFESVSGAVFGDLLQMETDREDRGSARHPFVSTVQRNLQRRYVSELISMIVEDEQGSTPPEVRNQARREAKRLWVLLQEGVGAEVQDPYSRAHLDEMIGRLGRAMEAQFQLGGGGGGAGGAIILRMGEDGELRLDPRDLPDRLRFRDDRGLPGLTGQELERR